VYFLYSLIIDSYGSKRKILGTAEKSIPGILRNHSAGTFIKMLGSLEKFLDLLSGHIFF